MDVEIFKLLLKLVHDFLDLFQIHGTHRRLQRLHHAPHLLRDLQIATQVLERTTQIRVFCVYYVM